MFQLFQEFKIKSRLNFSFLIILMVVKNEQNRSYNKGYTKRWFLSLIFVSPSNYFKILVSALSYVNINLSIAPFRLSCRLSCCRQMVDYSCNQKLEIQFFLSCSYIIDRNFHPFNHSSSPYYFSIYSGVFRMENIGN
jgi:hypothetical protein